MRFFSSRGRRMGFTTAFLGAVTAVVAVSLSAASPALAITADDCPTARAAGYTQTDVEIATDLALVADGVLEAVPQDTPDVVPRAAAVLVWAGVQTALRVIEHTYNIAQACDDNDHQQLVKDNLDVKVSTRATQTSVNALQTSVNAVQTIVTAVQTTVNTIQTIANQINTKVTTIGTTINANAALDLRLQIESDLSDSLTSSPIALFELPASQGGYIELARSIVAELITKMQATGQNILNAPKHLATGDALLAAKKYKQAYQEYASGYRDLSR
jgi:hypothetical protein